MVKNGMAITMRWLLIVLFPLWLHSAPSTTPKKKILILCSNGGNGHNSAARALKQILGDQFEFKVIYPIDELQIFGVKSGEALYNMALRNQWTRSVNVVSTHVAPKIFRGYKKALEELIAAELTQENPDLVISLTPFINLPATEAARKAKIPYLMVTTDNDLQTFLHGLQGVSHPHFKIVIAPYFLEARTMLFQRNIPDKNIAILGYPLRSDFLEKKEKKSLKDEYQIPPKKPVILVLMGGQGSETALDYAKKLGKTQLGIHLIVCAGRNHPLVKNLRKVKLHPTNSMTVMGFTDQMADLMAMADLIITKPGTLSTTESLTMRLPILIDCTSPVLSWELANIEIVRRYGVGTTVKNLNQLEPLVRSYLFDTELRHEIQKSYQQVPANRFNTSIAHLVDEMCALKQ
jgi:processive 1,2-diacylglycerol beta-glucosyltransferase